MLEDGSHVFSDEFGLVGEGVTTFVFPRGWLLEVNIVREGVYAYQSDGSEVRPSAARFAAFYPKFALISPVVRNAKGVCRGIASTASFSWLPATPVIFETDFEGEFAS